MLKKKIYKRILFSISCLLLLNAILPIRKSYANSQESSLDNILYENSNDDEDLEIFYDKHGYLVVRVTYENINNTNDLDNFTTYSSKQKFFSNPTWKPWKNIMSVNNSLAAFVINEAVASGLTAGIGKVFSLFYKVPSKVVRKLLNTITNGSISLKTQSIGKSAVKFGIKTKMGN